MAQESPTPKQKEAIESWERGDVCVVAGPGSGKTRVLVERVRWLIQEKGIPVRRILAITFTEKAAANMRLRLIQSFPPESAERKAVERAYISTIHAFCARILRENAIEAKVDPAFRVLDEWEADFELQQAIEDALEHEYQERPERVREFLAQFGSQDIHGNLFQLYQAVRAAGVPVENAGRGGETAGVGERRDALKDAFRQLEALPTFDWKFEQQRQLQEVLAAGLDGFEGMEINLNRFKRGSRQVELLKKIRDEMIPAWRAAERLDQNQQNREWFVEALAAANALYRERKRQTSALDYSDLEESAIRLLEDAGPRLRSAFSFVLMDEFQDTNPLQARLVDLLRGRGNFFAVGDINQSIYGFRHADPTVFRSFREKTAQDGGHVVLLLENFRSRGELLDSIKTIIAGAEGVEPQDLTPGKSFPPLDHPVLDVFAVQAEEGEDALQQEALETASRIASCGFRYGQIAVLLRTSAQVRVFEQALRQQGVPCEVAEGQGYYEAREVRDILCFLRVLLNPLDEISLAAVLRSPLAGADDEALFHLKLASSSLAAGLDAAADPKLAAFRELLGRYRRDRDTTSLDRLIGRLLSETGYEAWLLDQPAGAHRAANVRKLLALARRFHAGGLHGIQGFVDRIEQLRRSEVREPEARPPEQSANAVQVMTVHAAKGLEFPVVFLPAINRRPRSETDAVTFSPQFGVGMRWRDPRTGDDEPDAVAEAIAAQAKLDRRDESQRLFYVAMTRAEEMLVLSASFGQQVRIEQWASNLVKNFGTDFKILAQSRKTAPAAAAPMTVEQRAGGILVARPEIVDQGDTSVSATSVALFARCPRRYYLSRYLGFEEAAPVRIVGDEAPPERDEMDSSEFGRLVHAMLAGAVPRDSGHPEAVRLVESFEASAWGRRAAAAEAAGREQAFLVPLDGRLLSGQIDLWFRESGETVLLDYKTDQVSPEEASRRAADYELQLRLYALALQRNWTGLPKQAILYFLRPDVAVEVSLAPEALDAARGAVEDLYKAQSLVRFPLHIGEHCQRCPHFRGLCPAG